MSSHALPHTLAFTRRAALAPGPSAAERRLPAASTFSFPAWPHQGGATRRPGMLLVVAAAHVLLVLAMLALRVTPPAPPQPPPLQVRLLSLAATPPAPLPALRLPAQAMPSPPQLSLPVWVVLPATPVATAAPAPMAASVVTPEAPRPAPAVAAPTAAAAVPPPKPAPAPAQAEPRSVPASALRYLQPPAIELPMASRRLGEQGTVVLRVVFDVTGRPRELQVHRSSGHARLDQQALAAMQAARIAPYLENGRAVEVSALAPLAYELD